MAGSGGVETQTDARKRHSRETRMQIILPVVGGGAIIVLGVVIVMTLPRVIQVRAMSDFLVTLLLLCPLAVCLLPLALGLLVVAVSMNKVHDRAEGVLGRLVRLSETTSTRVESVADGVARRAIDASAKLAPLEQRLFGAFDQPVSTVTKEAKHDSTSVHQPRD